MRDTPQLPWIHIGECPVCVNGLCRVRTCEDEDGDQHLYAVCDECEALWIQPSTSSSIIYPDPDDPLCPVCLRPLWGDQAHWSHVAELKGTEWDENAIVVLPASMNSGPETQSPNPPSGESGKQIAEKAPGAREPEQANSGRNPEIDSQAGDAS